MKKSEIGRYLKEVGDALFCDKRQKKELLSSLKEEIEAFAQSQPDAGEEELIRVFGSPSEVAAAAGIDEKTVRKKTGVKKLVLFAVIAVLAVYLIFVIVSTVDMHTEMHGTFESGLLLSERIGGVLR